MDFFFAILIFFALVFVLKLLGSRSNKAKPEPHFSGNYRVASTKKDITPAVNRTTESSSYHKKAIRTYPATERTYNTSRDITSTRRNLSVRSSNEVSTNTSKKLEVKEGNYRIFINVRKDGKLVSVRPSQVVSLTFKCPLIF